VRRGRELGDWNLTEVNRIVIVCSGSDCLDLQIPLRCTRFAERPFWFCITNLPSVERCVWVLGYIAPEPLRFLVFEAQSRAQENQINKFRNGF
jgi:hypothetical protein